jgi:hypothetical protein
MGARVALLEKTDQLLGTGLVGGIMRNNGRFTAAEELRCLGAPELIDLTDSVARHREVRFPGHNHATLYDVSLVEPGVRALLTSAGVEVFLETRAVDLRRSGGHLEAVVAEGGREFPGDAFVETTGTAGPQGNCLRYGHGCVMCILRCPAFGPRVSLAGKAGVPERVGITSKGTLGSMSGSCKLLKDSLSTDVRQVLDDRGVCVLALPRHLRAEEKLPMKACQQYALPEFSDNLVLLDTGHAKMMTSYFPLEFLRSVPGLENARYEDPYAAGRGNSMRYFSMAPRDSTLRVEGLSNLFCAGEKCGPYVGHTEAIATGSLAGHNAARLAYGEELLKIPQGLAVGLAVWMVGREMETEEGIQKKYTFSGSFLFEAMKERGLYSTDLDTIERRVRESGVQGVFSEPLR